MSDDVCVYASRSLSHRWKALQHAQTHQSYAPRCTHDDMTDIYKRDKEQFWDNLQQKKALPQTATSASTSPEFKVRYLHVMVSISQSNINNG
jgi:hypothetical protein